MAKKADARKTREFCQPLAEDLATLADLLDSRGICPSVAPLSGAVAQMGNFADQNWGYEIGGLLFPLKQADNPSIPIHLGELFCTLDLRVSGIVPDDVDKALGDPFIGLNVDLVIRAKTASGDPAGVMWHFDRHIGRVNQPAAAHPIYHWHSGGNLARAFADELGTGHLLPILLLESPRIPHPPLDGVLAVDFVLSNFVSSEWGPIRLLPSYRSILKRSQRHFWRPYAAGIRRWFAKAIPPTADVESAWAAEDLWPHLLN